MSTLPAAEALKVADRVVNWCVRLQRGESVLLMTDTRSDQTFVDALWACADRAGADVMGLVLPYDRAEPHGYLTWSEPPSRLADIMAASRVVIVYMSNLLALTEAVAAARKGGTRFLWLPGSYDFSRPLIMVEDWDAVDELGRTICRALEGPCELEISSSSGTALTARLGREPRPFWDDARATAPGELDFFPGGMWNTIPEPDSVNGQVLFDGSLHPVGVLTEPVKVEFRQSQVVNISGGRQAIEWERWLRSFGDERILEFSHLSGGLAEHARVIGHDWEDLIIRGSILISGGENVLYGGGNAAKAHFDGVVLNVTMHVNGQLILENGRYLT